jgi:signal transduction histidine kinase
MRRRYIEMSARNDRAATKAALAIVLLVTAECATSVSRLAIAVGFNLALFPMNIAISRLLIPRLGARGDLVRTLLNTTASASGFYLMGWPLACWLWLPYTAVTFDQSGGHNSRLAVALMCLLQGTTAIATGVSPIVPITFTVLAGICWRSSTSRLAIVREMLARSEEQYAERLRLEDELLAMSRRAGMAEVATGVLHNVGNVLNSVNVSVALVDEGLRNARAASLAKTVAVAVAHPGGLAGFAATDKGQRFGDYLCRAATEIGDANGRLREELRSIAANVDHIKAIVATQQSFARAAPMRELVDLLEIFEAALRLGETDRAHHIEIVRELETMPRILTDRHAVLQILVNLITNAGKAVAETPGARRVTLRARRAGSYVDLSVADSGVGIPPENLERIFQHGFTTRADGHGFGLHSSANAARALGGSLVAASDGTDCGATFTLHIPADMPVDPSRRPEVAHELD